MPGLKEIHYKIRHLLDDDTRIRLLSDLSLRDLGYIPDFENPRKFNEKIMWMKLYYQDPLMTVCADKFAMKKYVSDLIGEEHVVPVIASWKSPDEIDFDSLPDQFVLKVNWSSGYNIIVTDKSKLNIKKTREKLRKWMRPEANSYYDRFNWAYKHMEPVIFAEEYIDQIDGQVYDYKFHMCGGKFEWLLIATNRANHDLLSFDYYDKDFNHLPIAISGTNNSSSVLKKPEHYDMMIELSERLARPFPFVRVDFYEVGGAVYVGEMTFYPGGGASRYIPQEWDLILGEKIPLPDKRITDKETARDRLLRRGKKEQIKMTEWGHMLRKKLVHRAKSKRGKYLSILGIRFMYETNTERKADTERKYIWLKGIEFRYRKKHIVRVPEDLSAVNVVPEVSWQDNSPVTAYLMEDKMDPKAQRIHFEQKAYHNLGYFPNLLNPRSWNEKTLWLALHYSNPVISAGTDKGTAKDWVARNVGKEYVVPLIGMYKDVNEIDFSTLPDRFVAKLNDGWGADQVMIVRDKSLLQIDKAKALMSSWLYPWKNYYYKNMCVLKDLKRDDTSIIIEQFLDAGDGRLPVDYKIFFCNGTPKFALVVENRFARGTTKTFVDMDWNVIPLTRPGEKRSETPARPEQLKKMIELGSQIAKDVPLVRIDYYELDGRIYIGELTYLPALFHKLDRKWDDELGTYLDLSDLMQSQLTGSTC